MDNKLKERWIKALRSGRYKQGTHALRSRADGQPLEYCCLGVLCNIIDRGGNDDCKWINGNTTDTFEYEGHTNDIRLPYPLRLSLNISFDKEDKLITLNDDRISFKKIADWIERNL